MLIMIIIVQQMEVAANENQKSISVTIQMCLVFLIISLSYMKAETSCSNGISCRKQNCRYSGDSTETQGDYY